VARNTANDVVLTQGNRLLINDLGAGPNRRMIVAYRASGRATAAKLVPDVIEAVTASLAPSI